MSIKLENKIKVVQSKRLVRCDEAFALLTKLDFLSYGKINPQIETFLFKRGSFNKKERKYLKKFRAEKGNHGVRYFIAKHDHEGWDLYTKEGILEMPYDNWLLVDRYLSLLISYESFFKELIETQKITRLKKKLCHLTDCYKDKDALKMVCEQCGTILDIECKYCHECGLKQEQ